MRRINFDSQAVDRLHEIGGVLDFQVFDAAPDEDAALAVDLAFAADYAYDPVALRALEPRRLDRAAFFGSWCDPDTGALVRRGTFTTAGGETVVDPRLSELEGVELRDGAWSNPAPGAGGEFAYAFLNPPYGLRATPAEIQSLFDEIAGAILPDGADAEILDWASPELTRVSPAFEAGMEWWGVFLFTIRLPSLGRLTVISASTTD